MIKLNKKTQQDFLNVAWVQRLLKSGVDMSDSEYCIVRLLDKYYVTTNSDSKKKSNEFFDYTVICPTYTVSQLLYKLHEWIYPTIDGKKYSGGLILQKDAPFYTASYDLHDNDMNWSEEFMCISEYPIESLAELLILCHKRAIGCGMQDTGNISSKG